MIFTFSPIYYSNTNETNTNEIVFVNINNFDSTRQMYVFGHQIRLKSIHSLQLFDVQSKEVLHNPPVVKLLKYIPTKVYTFEKYNRRKIIKSFKFPAQYTYISRDKHAILLIDGEEEFNPYRFQRLEKTQLKHYRGSCTWWCLWYVMYRESNKQYSRKFLESYALYMLRNNASEYISMIIFTIINRKNYFDQK